MDGIDVFILIYGNLFWIGCLVLLFSTVVWMTGRGAYRPSRARKICVVQMIAFGVTALGVGPISLRYGFTNTFWDLAGYIAFGGMAFGALIESRRNLPLAKREARDSFDRIWNEDPEEALKLYLRADEVGLEAALIEKIGS
ncbi:MAG: hypothetical protein KDA73_12140 [Rhodobacteraceae bacterium]|nr:hypothetical protein [Paracoccaceae bacterium]